MISSWTIALSRFDQIFPPIPDVPVIVVPGNHDIGLHSRISAARLHAFSDRFGPPDAVHHVNGFTIVGVNAQALGYESDGIVTDIMDRQRKSVAEMAARTANGARGAREVRRCRRGC